MQRFNLRREQYLPIDQATTFAFFADARNLERLTPSWLHFKVLTAEPLHLQAGSLLDYRLRLHGLPLRWQSEITLWEPLSRFVDVQRRGPYRIWEHTHTFEPLGAGTIVRDSVVYAVPGGGLINRFLVRPDLERVFDYRARRLNAWVLAYLRSELPAVQSADANVRLRLS
jgi:ligand-binding SRPBCC domain-containing protein